MIFMYFVSCLCFVCFWCWLCSSASNENIVRFRVGWGKSCPLLYICFENFSIFLQFFLALGTFMPF